MLIVLHITKINCFFSDFGFEETGVDIFDRFGYGHDDHHGYGDHFGYHWKGS